MKTNAHQPILLLILDGFGYREASEGNAILAANTPHYDTLWQNNPHTLLDASGKTVGLPDHQMGNSEVGHMTIGAGRIIHQDLTRIHLAIKDGSFNENPILLQTLQDIAASGKTLHLMGLLSDGGVHSHQDHLFALLKLAKQEGVNHIAIHVFLDGRDTAPQSAEASLKQLLDLKIGHIKTLCGRFYAMDRDERFERTEKAFNAIVHANAQHHAHNVLDALNAAYARNETDEFVQPYIIGEPHPMQDGDAVIFFNFRSDRARQLSRLLLEKQHLSHFVSFTEYAKDIHSEIAFPKPQPQNTLSEILSKNALTQLHIAETEKYAHVTFFFNGGREAPFENETRCLIHSPKVKTYDLQPEMSAPELTDKLCDAIESKHYDVIICNYANPDMVGHTGNFDATVKAIECIDKCLGRIIKSLDKTQGELILSADHGNADCMIDPKTHKALTSHTNNLVPFIYRGRHATIKNETGSLQDIAPSLLHLLGIAKPEVMTGHSLITLDNE